MGRKAVLNMLADRQQVTGDASPGVVFTLFSTTQVSARTGRSTTGLQLGLSANMLYRLVP